MNLKPTNDTVVGIDVGGIKKGFHGVAMRDGKFIHVEKGNLSTIVSWIDAQNPSVVAVDAPCKWSSDEGDWSSRRAERELSLFGEKISCFSTPSEKRAADRDFYRWVVNGQTLYHALESAYPLFLGKRIQIRTCVETFPHAVACALAGEIVSAKQKSTTRRRVLRASSYDPTPLVNIDFVDAGLCSIAAAAFHSGHYRAFGEQEEGFIVVPDRQRV